MTNVDITPVRLGFADILRVGLIGIRTRRMRAVLSALGISIGIATLVLVSSIPASSQAGLEERLTALGSNQLRVDPLPQDEGTVVLPTQSEAMALRIGPVTGAAMVANTHATVRRNDRVDANQTSGLTVLASSPSLLATLSGTMYEGTFLTATNSNAPVVVLGSVAAQRLGIDHLAAGQPAPRVYIDGHFFAVIGILDPMPLASDIERSVLIGWDVAEEQLGFDGHPTVVYVTAREDSVESVRQVLAATLSPKASGLVQVSRPSAALAAKEAANETFNGLFIGLSGVALLVGGVGVANTMFISVLERRKEIGLRRALGATRRQIGAQFFTEALALSALGGLAGIVIGTLATLDYTALQGWPTVIPFATIAAGFGGALVVGALAGINPSIRAARLTPTEALATS